MERIDLKNKFFHSILTGSSFYESPDNKLAIEKLESILQSNKLYSRKSLLDNDYLEKYIPFSYDIFYNEPTEICLAAYPNIGEYSFIREGNSIIDAYYYFVKSDKRMCLIFDNQILNDYQIRKGKLHNEYYLTGDLDISKYLVGIGHAGLEIRKNLLILYYYFKYYNNEISLDDFLVNTGEGVASYKRDYYDLNNIKNIAEIIDCRPWAEYLLSDGKRKVEFALNSAEHYLVEYDIYNALINISEKYNVKLYDGCGVLIQDRNKRIEEIKEMINYVLQQLDATEEDRTKYLMQKKYI
ncbi:MAG: hypothetical protein J5892_01120 [Bacilli bacterium]|nr:hypothetical protein [Bacilli bacterium]